MQIISSCVNVRTTRIQDIFPSMCKIDIPILPEFVNLDKKLSASCCEKELKKLYIYISFLGPVAQLVRASDS